MGEEAASLLNENVQNATHNSDYFIVEAQIEFYSRIKALAKRYNNTHTHTHTHTPPLRCWMYSFGKHRLEHEFHFVSFLFAVATWNSCATRARTYQVDVSRLCCNAFSHCHFRAYILLRVWVSCMRTWTSSNSLGFNRVWSSWAKMVYAKHLLAAIVYALAGNTIFPI